jgi:hypothetical protein
LHNGYWGFPSLGQGMMLTAHPLLVPRSRKRGAILPFPQVPLMVSSRVSIYKFKINHIKCCKRSYWLKKYRKDISKYGMTPQKDMKNESSIFKTFTIT